MGTWVTLARRCLETGGHFAVRLASQRYDITCDYARDRA